MSIFSLIVNILGLVVFVQISMRVQMCSNSIIQKNWSLRLESDDITAIIVLLHFSCGYLHTKWFLWGNGKDVDDIPTCKFAMHNQRHHRRKRRYELIKCQSLSHCTRSLEWNNKSWEYRIFRLIDTFRRRAMVFAWT